MNADVLVIGAGAAGLACAAALQAAGRSVVVLEAGSSVGGRIRSHRSESGATWELGAQVVHDRTNPVWSQIGPGALKPFGDSDFRCLIGGRSLPLSVLARLGRPPWMIIPSLAAAVPPVIGSAALWLAGLPAPARKVGLDWLGQDWAADPAGFEVHRTAGDRHRHRCSRRRGDRDRRLGRDDDPTGACTGRPGLQPGAAVAFRSSA